MLKVSLDIDPNNKETKITIHCSEVNDKIKEILDFLKEKDTKFIVGKNGEMQHILKPNDIHFFYSQEDSVLAVTPGGEFKVKERLYELEEILPSNRFIRLSKSVIANLYELSHFEASFNGTLCVYFKSGAKEYVTRNYVGKIKETLKMNRRKSE